MNPQRSLWALVASLVMTTVFASHLSAEDGIRSVGTITIGGPTGPNGQQVTCDLPVSQRTKNIGGVDGAGLCVFSSIGHSARYQDERRLVNFQKDMSHERGGGYPEKVDQMIAKYGAGTPYIQYQGKDDTILITALKTGRMPGITYCGQDTHYRGQTIAHMTNLVFYDGTMACILDNNFIKEDDLVWMDKADFMKRWLGNGGGWTVILLNPPPPPVPHN